VNALWTGVITHLWQTTLVLALIGLLATLLRRAPARYIEGLWTVALLKLLVPLPLLLALWPGLERIGASAGQQQAIGPAVQRLSQLAYPDVLRIEPVEPAAGASSVFAMAVAALWALGTITLLALWWRRTRSPEPANEAPWHAGDDVAERVGRAARVAGVPLNRIRITDATIVPCVGNFRRPTVLLPRAVVQSLRDDELRAVLLHEDAHRRRGDLWRAALQRLTTCVFYFYPPAWWLTRRLRAAAEMACDEAVLATGIDARTYARALARTVVLDLDALPVPALASGRSHLSARLQRIQQPERYAAMKHHRLAIIAAVAVAVGASLVPVENSVGLPSVSPARSAEELTVEQRQGEWVPASDLRGLDGLDVIVELSTGSRRITEVLQELGWRAGFEVYLTSSEDLRGTAMSMPAAEIDVRDALEILGEHAGLEYRVVDRTTLIVRLRPEVRAERELQKLDASLQREQAREEAARTGTGTMNVRALGRDGAPLAGVAVVTRGPAGPRTEYTSVEGIARFPGLEPGAYTATFTLDGFKTFVREGLEIRAQRTTAFAVALERRAPGQVPSQH